MLELGIYFSSSLENTVGISALLVPFKFFSTHY